MRHALPIADVNFISIYGPCYTVVANQEIIIESGYLKPEQMPDERAKSYKRPGMDGTKISRLGDGSIRFITKASYIINKDIPFQKMMGKILGDYQLSLVAGEKI